MRDSEYEYEFSNVERVHKMITQHRNVVIGVSFSNSQQQGGVTEGSGSIEGAYKFAFA